MSARRLDAATLREWAHTAVGDLITHTDEINRLNVFPVADADTGHKHAVHHAFGMGARRRAVRRRRRRAGGRRAGADGALQGARGNSGVILSQILRGLADVTAAAPADRRGVLADVDGALFGAALRHAVGLVVTSMGEAVPGTIVSVLQDAAGAAEDAAADGSELAEVVLAAADTAAVVARQDHWTTRRPGRGRRGGRRRPRPAGTAGRDEHHADRACAAPAGVRAVTAARRRACGHHARRAAVRGDVPARAVATPPGSKSCAGSLDRLGESVAIAASVGRCRAVLRPRTRRRRRRRRRGGPVGGHAQPHSDHVAHRRPRVRVRPEAGHWNGRYWRLSTASAPRNCSRRRRTRTAAGRRRARERQAAASCVGQCGRRRRSWCCPTGTSPPRNSSLDAPLRSAGASTWCRCPPRRWCRGWPRWRSMTPTGRPSTTATPWPVPRRPPGTDRCGSPPRRRSPGPGTCKPGDGLGISGDEVLIVGEDITAAGAGLIDLLAGRRRRTGHGADRRRRRQPASARPCGSTSTVNTSAPSW